MEELRPESKPEAPAMGGNLASPMDRFVAALIDGVLISVVMAIPFGFLVGIAYLLTKDALPFLEGQSVGKKLMKMRVVDDETGAAITNDYGKSAIRALSLLIPIFNLVDALMVFGDERKRFGDKWANTKVIKLSA